MKQEKVYMIQIEFGNLVTPLVILVLCVTPISIILFSIYKGLKIDYKKPKYARSRYKYILWRLIFVKSTILAPVVWWVFDTIGRVTGSSSLPLGLRELSVAWFIWCAIIFIYRKLSRKIFRKNTDRAQEKSPTPFYNDKK